MCVWYKNTYMSCGKNKVKKKKKPSGGIRRGCRRVCVGRRRLWASAAAEQKTMQLVECIGCGNNNNKKKNTN